MTRSSDRDGILKVGPQHYRVSLELPRRADGRRRRETQAVRGSLEDATVACSSACCEADALREMLKSPNLAHKARLDPAAEEAGDNEPRGRDE